MQSVSSSVRDCAVSADKMRELNWSTDQQNNERWARELREYWHSRGFPQVRAFAVQKDAGGPFDSTRSRFFWSVESNLVNGLPPRSKK